MSLFLDPYTQPNSSRSPLDPEYDLSDLDFDNLQDPPDGVTGAGGIEDMGREDRKAGLEELEGADQNDWMKVFVPSLLLAGFPRQTTSVDMQSPLTGPSSASHNAHLFPATPSVDPVPIPVPVPEMTAPPALHPYPNSLAPGGHFEFSTLPSSISYHPSYTSHSTSPPLTLSTLRYPFQTLDLYGPTYANSLFPQAPPISPSSAMMQYLNFPETPLPPMTSQAGQGMFPLADGSGQTLFGGQMAQSQEVEMAGAPADGWDIFRTPVLPVAPGAGVGAYQAGMKRKHGRPRCTFSQTRPIPSMAATSPATAASTTSDAAARTISRDEQIKTQVALEAELKSAVDELNGRVRGILGRTTPDVVRDAGVSAILSETTGNWGSANAIINKVIGPPIQVPTASPTPTSAAPSPLQSRASSPAMFSLGDTKAPRPATHKGPWLPAEVERVRQIVATSCDMLEGVSVVDWKLVAQEFGPTRSKHQIMCKAVDLGLKGTTTTAGRRKRQKRHQHPSFPNLRHSVSTSGDDGDAEDEIYSCTTATSLTSSL